MWDLTVLIPDRRLSIYFTSKIRKNAIASISTSIHTFFLLFFKWELHRKK